MAMTRLVGFVTLSLAFMAAPASADWREDLGVFRIGMVASPGEGAVVEGAAAIRDAYATALGMKVEIFVARDYAALIDAQASSRIEYAIHSASSYAAAWRTCSCVEPIAAPVSADGATGIRSVLIASDAALSLASLNAHRVAFGPPDSVSAYLLPLAEFAPGGTPIDGSEDWLLRVASEAEAERMFVEGSADAMFGYVPSGPAQGAAGGGTLDRLEAAGVTGLRVLWTSSLLRFGPHTVRTNLPNEAKQTLRTFLATLREAEPDIYDLLERNHGGGFRPAPHAEYQPAIGMARALARD